MAITNRKTPYALSVVAISAPLLAGAGGCHAVKSSAENFHSVTTRNPANMMAAHTGMMAILPRGIDGRRDLFLAWPSQTEPGRLLVFQASLPLERYHELTGVTRQSAARTRLSGVFSASTYFNIPEAKLLPLAEANQAVRQKFQPLLTAERDKASQGSIGNALEPHLIAFVVDGETIQPIRNRGGDTYQLRIQNPVAAEGEKLIQQIDQTSRWLQPEPFVEAEISRAFLMRQHQRG